MAQKKLIFLLSIGLVFGTGCRNFIEPPAPAPESPREGDVVVGSALLVKHQTLAIEVETADGTFEARRIEVKEPDGEIEMKGTVSSPFADDGVILVEGVPFRLSEESKIVDQDGSTIDPAAFGRGAWVKVESKLVDDELEIRKITRRQRQVDEFVRIAGTVEAIDHGDDLVFIGPIEVHYAQDVLVVWRRESEPAPRPIADEEQRVRAFHPGLARVRHIDDDDVRPESGFRLGDLVAFSGEVQYDVEWRDNFDLRDDLERDRAFQEASLVIESAIAVNRNLAAFVKLNARYEWIIADQRNNLDGGEDINLEEAFVLIDDAPFGGVSLQIGRQDFDDGREWVMDDNLDAARLWLNFDAAIVELSISQTLFDTTPENDGITNFLLGVHAEPFRDQTLFAYVLHRRNGTLIDLERTHVGVSLEGEVDALTWWLDVGGAFGKEDETDVSGWGIDVAAMYVFEDLPFEPSIFAGFAMGSGDDDLTDGKDGNFRQTGLNDNNDRFNGVTSFRYLGELLRPDLSNIMVFTVGAGFRPFEDTSIDLVFHHYEQVEAATFLGPTRLRTDAPNGIDRELGQEIDLVIGFEHFRPVEVEIVISYFHPTDAFEPIDQDDAWFITATVEYNF